MNNEDYGIRGTATTHSGDVVKYIRVFDWGTGILKDVIRPSLLNGMWEYITLFDETIGLTYIADNEAPYTNGPYITYGKYGDTVMSGFLLVAYISATGVPAYDVAAKSQPTWQAYFGQVEDIGLFNYKHGSGALPLMSKIINMFSLDWNMQIDGSNGSQGGDSHTWTLEFMDVNNVVICAVKSDYGSTYSSNLFYGKDLANLTMTGRDGYYTATGGNITFTPTSLIYTNSRSSQYNKSFTYNFDALAVTKIRVSGKANVGSYGAGGYILLIEPTQE